MSDQEKGRWVVKVRCTIIKEVACEDCTEEEVRNDPFGYAYDETEVTIEEIHDVISVEPDE